MSKIKIKTFENDKEFINSFKGQTNKEIEERLKNISLVSIEEDNGKGDTFSKDFFVEKFKSDDIDKKNPKNIYDEDEFLKNMKYEVKGQDKYSGETRVLFYNLKENDSITTTRDFFKKNEESIDLDDFNESVVSLFYERCDKAIEFQDILKEETLTKTLKFIHEHTKNFDMNLTFSNVEMDNFTISIKDENNKEEIKINDTQLNNFLDKTIKYIVCKDEEIDLLNCGAGIDLDDYEETRSWVKDINESDMSEEKKATLRDKAMFKSPILSNDINEVDFTLPTYYSLEKEKSEVTEVNFNYNSEKSSDEVVISINDKWNTPYEYYANKEENVISINNKLGLLLQDKDYFKDFFEEYREKNYLDKDISYNLVMIENMNKFEKFENTKNNLISATLDETFKKTFEELSPEMIFGETLNKKAMEKFDENFKERFADMSTRDKYTYIVNNAEDFNLEVSFQNGENQIVDFEYDRLKNDIDFDDNVDNIIKSKFIEEKQKLSDEILEKSYERFVVIPLSELCDNYEKKSNDFEEKKEEYISKFVENYINEYKEQENIIKTEKDFKENLNKEVKKHILSLSETKIDKAINNYLEKNNLSSLEDSFGTKKQIDKEVKEEIKDKEIDM